jgi:hypothetical protein
MNKKDIETRLDRSLANQIAAPRLDDRFDAGVWARIEASSATATNPGRVVPLSNVSRASRWLFISNAIGILVAIVVAVYFGLRAFGVLDMTGVATPDVSLPGISEATLLQLAQVLGHVLGGVALLFGLSLTSFGHRIRAAFS